VLRSPLSGTQPLDLNPYQLYVIGDVQHIYYHRDSLYGSAVLLKNTDTPFCAHIRLQ
jgi:hypothetical protein